jgi:hypothetical protein
MQGELSGFCNGQMVPVPGTGNRDHLFANRSLFLISVSQRRRISEIFRPEFFRLTFPQVSWNNLFLNEKNFRPIRSDNHAEVSGGRRKHELENFAQTGFGLVDRPCFDCILFTQGPGRAGAGGA